LGSGCHLIEVKGSATIWYNKILSIKGSPFKSERAWQKSDTYTEDWNHFTSTLSRSATVAINSIKSQLMIDRVCKCNVSNDEILRILTIITHYGESAIVNSEQ